MSTPTKTETFSQWFDRQGFKHFKAHELTWYFGKVNKGIKNSEPPRELWVNIIPTLRILDSFRSSEGKPITIHSTYRSPSYNKSVNGASSSLHLKFNAIDFTVSGMTPASVFSKLLKLRNEGKFKGGLGKYNTFVHIDTRANNATW